MNLRHILIAAFAVAAPIAFVAPAQADGGVFVGVEGGEIAVSGYDVVSYFQGSGQPVKGSASHKVRYNDAVWHFSSQANADAFKADPAKFAPQYGGHCAWAMSRGSLAPGDPTLYRIHDGKLYLNFNKNVQQTWLGDIAGFIAKSDPAWASVPEGKRFGG